MKFKVGDKVRVKEGLEAGKLYGNIHYWDWEYDTDIHEVAYITEEGNYRLIEGNGYYYSGEMLEPVIEPKTVEKPVEKIVIYRDGDKTIAKYYKGDKVVSAEAKCCSCGEYNFKTDAQLVKDRVIEKMEEEEISYSWVKCVGYRQKNEFYFTVDKIYKISDDGKIASDKGNVYGKYRSSKQETLDFLSKWYIFEEVENPS